MTPRRLRSAAALCTIAIAATAQTAAAQTTVRTELHMIAAPSEVPVGETLTAAKGEPVLVTFAQSPRAVRLDADVVVGKLASGNTLKAGDVLFGRYDDGQWTYCAIDRLDGGGEFVNEAIVGIFTGGLSLLDGPARYVECLHDADGDGVFDSAWTGGETQTENAFLAYTLTRQSISGPTPYSRIDYTDGPAMVVRVDWSKRRKSGSIAFTVDIGDLDLQTKTVPVPAPGGDSQTLSILGAELEILGYDADAETLSFRVNDNTARQYLLVPASLTTTTTYVTY